MSTAVKDQLWRLVKSLNKAEKRNFKIFATRAGGTAESKFVLLFNSLDKATELDDALVMRRLKLSPGKYSNLKRHLYQELLKSLRLIHIDKEIDIELREQIDFSRILYGKGHYLDALRTLERAKAKAIEHNQDLLHLEILEFQKLIEARHVTLSRQVTDKMDILLNESAEKSHSILTTSELLNMNIQIHGRYIERGHGRTPNEIAQTKEFWADIQTARVTSATARSTFHQQVNRLQAGMWYQYIQLNFEESLEAAQSAVTLFTLSRQMTVKDPDLYLRCLYYVTVFAYLTEQPTVIRKYRARLSAFLEDDKVKFNENSLRIGVVYRKLSRYNELFQAGRLAEAYAFSQRVAADYQSGVFVPAEHRWGLFLYKSAAAAFLVSRYSDAIDDLNDIVNMKTGTHREDLLISTKLLHALCNYQMEHYSLVDYHLTSLARLLRRSRETAELHRLMVAGLRKLISLPVAERAPVFARLTAQIDALRADPFERKALTYLEVGYWLSLHE
ncbi:hypothetical protein [Neolewinella antarctica]|uniref:Uncharacterized protein n=1 Tax=Neolewinella antarctica TaxID=442734 RepID=A0ABX0XBE9_9BACT|nr:hypothetical protein [Neolewinella antarctica]NJC26527.1 hypothetical protein [Neolewinella antarctica]